MMQKRLLEHKKINMVWSSVPMEAIGGNSLTGVKIQNVKDKTEKILEANGLFYAVGHIPNTEFLNGQIQTDAGGYIITSAGTTQTNIKGVFACGDVQDKRYRQAITAAGTGCMAALEVEKFLAE